MKPEDVRDRMHFETTDLARVQERFVVGQDAQHSAPLVRRWLAIGTVRPVSDTIKKPRSGPSRKAGVTKNGSGA